jgi:MreB/Mbl protein
VVRGVPHDLGGNTAGEVVRQASDDDRDGGNVLGRLATHGVVLAAPGRQARSGSWRAELPCPLTAVDLGTANTLVYVWPGIALNEPSVVALNTA